MERRSRPDNVVENAPFGCPRQGAISSAFFLARSAHNGHGGAANNAGSESRRVVAVPLAVALAQAVAIGSGYLLPASDGPKYTKGAAVETALSAAGMVFTFVYMGLIEWENARRDKREGRPPEAGHRPDTAEHADDAPGLRYIG
ncbi:hypothetical protein CERZMDRAFT_81669 [Cercospora zeae-maydis SCOH1-5]|uniref:Uncharacterized protein n=1 Tax=Cercospora zeae-maydis SCOH1-5 TaxID=717836 RepID=A0A6A6FT89_9PEZI|nr:hypothetical protein CERZMDRAFT_81669 [Cercospora zeae-maydis SCOH1-5]